FQGNILDQLQAGAMKRKKTSLQFFLHQRHGTPSLGILLDLSNSAKLIDFASIARYNSKL
ncbi:MAG: hypothetical protein NZL98_10275, partial [Anaerolineales bacterium]|nr:hypothetical protein [Anaerolineales bacterium]